MLRPKTNCKNRVKHPVCCIENYKILLISVYTENIWNNDGSVTNDALLEAQTSDLIHPPSARSHRCLHLRGAEVIRISNHVHTSRMCKSIHCKTNKKYSLHNYLNDMYNLYIIIFKIGVYMCLGREAILHSTCLPPPPLRCSPFSARFHQLHPVFSAAVQGHGHLKESWPKFTIQGP